MKELKVSETLYYLAFALYFIITSIGRINLTEQQQLSIQPLQNLLQLSIIIILFVKFILQRLPFHGWLIAALIVILGYISWRQSDEGWLFWLALFIICSDEISLRCLAKIALVLSICILTSTICLSFLGLIKDEVSVRLGIERHSLGFSHPNNLGLFLIVFCTSFSIIRFGKNPLPDLAVLTFCGIINMLAADSRSMTILCIVQGIFLVVLYYCNSPISQKIILYIISIIILITILFSIYLMFTFDQSNAVHRLIDQIFSGRINLAHRYYQLQPLSLLGNRYDGFAPIAWQDGTPRTFVVDNAWCHLLLRYGIIPSISLIISIIIVYIKKIKQNKLDAIIFGLTLMVIYGAVETMGIRFECNYFLFSIGTELLYATSKSQTEYI